MPNLLHSNKELIIEMRLVGHTVSDAAKVFGVTKQYVSLVSGSVSYDRICKYCGAAFITTTANSYFCPYTAHGAEYKRVGRRLSRVEKIRDKVDKDPSGCHIWKGATDVAGYGNIMWNGHSINAHRWFWMQANGEIPVGMWVLHKCDNPTCVNVEHLFLGTASDNARDRDAKGRGRARNALNKIQVQKIRASYKSLPDALLLGEAFNVHPKTIYNVATGRTYTGRSPKAGEVYHSSKLTLVQAHRIRDLYSYGRHTLTSLGLMYGVHYSTIHRIVKNVCYVDKNLALEARL